MAVLWWSGGIVRNSLVGFWSPTLTVKDPQIPNLPLESPGGGVWEINISDIGSGSDLILRNKLFTISDSGLGTDNLAALKVFFTLLESGSGSDTINVNPGFILVGITDVGVGTDFVFQRATIVLLDSGLGNDVPVVKAEIDIVDAGSGTDAILAKLFKLLNDYGYGSEEVMTTSPAKFVQDFGVGVDLLNLYFGGRKPRRVMLRVLTKKPPKKY